MVIGYASWICFIKSLRYPLFCPTGTFRFAERMECFVSWISCQSEYFFIVPYLNYYLFIFSNIVCFKGHLITHWNKLSGHFTLFPSLGEIGSTYSTGKSSSALSSLSLIIKIWILLLIVNLLQFRLAWKVTAKGYLLMVFHFPLRLGKLILVNQEQMVSTVSIN